MDDSLLTDDDCLSLAFLGFFSVSNVFHYLTLRHHLLGQETEDVH